MSGHSLTGAHPWSIGDGRGDGVYDSRKREIYLIALATALNFIATALNVGLAFVRVGLAFVLGRSKVPSS